MEGDDYADTLAVDADRCYRYVCIDDAGRPGPCQAEVRWQGRYRGAGRWWDVVTCDRHAKAVTDRKRIG